MRRLYPIIISCSTSCILALAPAITHTAAAQQYESRANCRPYDTSPECSDSGGGYYNNQTQHDNRGDGIILESTPQPAPAPPPDPVDREFWDRVQPLDGERPADSFWHYCRDVPDAYNDYPLTTVYNFKIYAMRRAKTYEASYYDPYSLRRPTPQEIDLLISAYNEANCWNAKLEALRRYCIHFPTQGPHVPPLCR